MGRNLLIAQGRRVKEEGKHPSVGDMQFVWKVTITASRSLKPAASRPAIFPAFAVIEGDFHFHNKSL